MSTQAMWNADLPISTFSIEIPSWIDPDISPSTVAAILQGGCASGAYMPAVTYWQALDTMADHGDDILDYLYEGGDIDALPVETGWSGLACYFVSAGVELWAAMVADEVEAAIADVETDYPDHQEGYPVYYVDHDGSVLCGECVAGEILAGDVDPDTITPAPHWEGPNLCCEGCNKEIESAYGDPDADADEGAA